MWDDWQSGEAEVGEVEAESQRLSAALEVQYRESVHAEMQLLAAQHRYEAAVRQKERRTAEPVGTDDDEHQSAARYTQHNNGRCQSIGYLSLPVVRMLLR